MSEENLPTFKIAGTDVEVTVADSGHFVVPQKQLIAINGLGKVLTDLEIAIAQYNGQLLGLDTTFRVEDDFVTGDVHFYWGTST